MWKAQLKRSAGSHSAFVRCRLPEPFGLNTSTPRSRIADARTLPRWIYRFNSWSSRPLVVTPGTVSKATVAPR